MKKKILITPKSFSKAKDQALKLLGKYDMEIIENHMGKTLTEEQMVQICEDIDGIIVGIDPMSERVLRNAKRLKAISKYGAGLDNIDVDVAKEMGIKLDRAVGTNATSVAELAVGMFFSLSRNMVKHANLVKSGSWSRTLGCELTGKLVGIIGLGYVGREVARLATGLGMHVIAYDPFFKDKEFLNKYEIEITDLYSVFRLGDFITLHLPLTSDTRHLVNEDLLKYMKKTAYLINTSRGELIDEDALYDALIKGAIAGAASDVFSKEPPGEHKLLTVDNFILTPHIGAYTKEAIEKMVVKSTKNLINMLYDQ